MALIKSPLRYPGGKSKALGQIFNFLPPRFTDYREPFIGGGSVFIYLKQQRPLLRAWINDFNYDLYCFWKFAQAEPHEMTAEIAKIKRENKDGRQLFQSLTAGVSADISDFDRAVRFFVLNRITFSGTVEAGGYSQKAFEARFTDSSIERLRKLSQLLDENVVITNLDYDEMLRELGEDVFIFLDPPYLSATKSKLYGKKGALHTGFDHARFAEAMRACRHKWLITYDDCPEVRENFLFAHVYEWELQYGMNNFGRTFAPKGKELFITNYPVEIAEAQLQLSFP